MRTKTRRKTASKARRNGHAKPEPTQRDRELYHEAKEGLGAFARIGSTLREMRDGRTYARWVTRTAPNGYRTFEEFAAADAGGRDLVLWPHRWAATLRTTPARGFAACWRVSTDWGAAEIL